MRENTIGGRQAREPGPAEVVSEEHHQHRSTKLPVPWIRVRVGLQMADEADVANRPNGDGRSRQKTRAQIQRPLEKISAGRAPQFLFPALDTPSRGKMSMQRRIRTPSGRSGEGSGEITRGSAFAGSRPSLEFLRLPDHGPKITCSCDKIPC